MVANTMRSYPKIYNIGHRMILPIFDDPVLVEEKIDGSQFSFGAYLIEGNVELRCRSKGAEINVFAPEKMFAKGVETAGRLFQGELLEVGWTYRCEFLGRPKHNVLAYDNIPPHNLILLDVEVSEGSFLSPDEKWEEADRLGLMVVPRLYSGRLDSLELFQSLLEKTSILGGQKIEGLVVKNYSRFGADGKPLFGKYVSEAFKEVHKGDWRERNPHGKDILQMLGAQYKTPARWAKAVQHLREAGVLEDAPKDIGILIPEISKDIFVECEAEIKEALFKWAWPSIRRQVTSGMPQWYKDELLKRSFDEPQGQPTAEHASTVVHSTK